MHHPRLISTFHWRPYPLLIGCCFLMAGCGSSRPETSSVTGRVTFQGKAVTSGHIVFYPTEGRPSRGNLGPEGTYTLTTFRDGDGALLGKHRVTIEAKQVSGPPAPKSFKEERANPASLVQQKVEWLLPEKYAREDTSPLTADVVRGSNTIDFSLP